MRDAGTDIIAVRDFRGEILIDQVEDNAKFIDGLAVAAVLPGICYALNRSNKQFVSLQLSDEVCLRHGCEWS